MPGGGGGQNGACCYQDQCIYGTEAACNTVGGDFQGIGVLCSDVDCTTSTPTGACCTGSTCSVGTEADCNGTYQGDDTDCSGNPCGGGGSDAFVGLTWSIVGANLVEDDDPTWTVDVYAILDDGCRLDAVAGDVNQQKMITTTTSFYQNPYGGPTSTSINPLLFGTFPDLEFDSFVTIGLTNSDDNVLSNIGIDWNDFENGGSVDSSDGSWFITPDDVQGVSDAFADEVCEDSNGVLIARLTTRDLDSSIMVEALFQGKDASGITWQSSGSAVIVYDDCNVQCVGDYNGSGITNVEDLLYVIAGWGDPYDVEDLLTVIADWGCGTP